MAYSIELATSVTADEANNRSTITATYTLVSTLASQFQNWTLTVWLKIDGQTVHSATQQYSMTGATATRLPIATKSLTVSHNSAGAYGPVTVQAYVSAVSQTSYTPNGVTASKSVPLTDYLRLPIMLAGPTLNRTGTGRTISVYSGAVDTRGNAITDYQYRWAVENGTWSIAYPMDNGGSAVFGPNYPTTVSPTTNYSFQTRATTTEGTSAWSATSTVTAVPSAPSSLFVSRSRRSLTLVVGPATGSSILNYYAQISTDGGTTWGAQQTVSPFTHYATFSNLAPGITYTFRAWAVNNVGAGDYATTAFFLTAGGYRVEIDTPIDTVIARRYDPTDPKAVDGWVDIKTGKRYDPTNPQAVNGWVNLG